MDKIIKAIEESKFEEITDVYNKGAYYTSAKQVIEIYDDKIGWRVWVK